MLRSLNPIRLAVKLFCTILALVAFGMRTQDNPVFRGESQIVFVPALVRNTHGQPVYGLQAKDFSLEDDGIEQPIQIDERSDIEPVSIVVALQIGRRAKREFSRIVRLGSMLDDILAEGETISEITLVQFDSRVRTVRGFTRDETPVAEYLKNISPGDHGAAILDAVNYSVKLLDKLPRGHERILLLISETRDHGSHKAKLDQVVEAVGTSNVQIYAVPFSPSLSQVLDTERGLNKDEWRPAQSPLDVGGPSLIMMNAARKNVAKGLASMTGGQYEPFASRKSFENDLFDFTNRLRSRYVLTFEPKQPHAGLHRLRVGLRESNDMTVLARTCYWAQH
jgi:VWFA-related protein